MSKIMLEAAPAGESLERIYCRFVVLALRRISAGQKGIPKIDAIADLRERSFFGDDPGENEWHKARVKLKRARSRSYSYSSAIARSYSSAIALDTGVRDLGNCAHEIVDDLIILLGDRLEPIKALDARILSAIEIEKSFGLEMSQWHCGTTHCRFGSACYMHPLGSELERVFGNWLAGAVIYKKSTGRVPNAYEKDNEVALADIRRCAAEQEAKA